MGHCPVSMCRRGYHGELLPAVKALEDALVKALEAVQPLQQIGAPAVELTSETGFSPGAADVMTAAREAVTVLEVVRLKHSGLTAALEALRVRHRQASTAQPQEESGQLDGQASSTAPATAALVAALEPVLRCAQGPAGGPEGGPSADTSGPLTEATAVLRKVKARLNGEHKTPLDLLCNALRVS